MNNEPDPIESAKALPIPEDPFLIVLYTENSYSPREVASLRAIFPDHVAGLVVLPRGSALELVDDEDLRRVGLQRIAPAIPASWFIATDEAGIASIWKHGDPPTPISCESDMGGELWDVLAALIPEREIG